MAGSARVPQERIDALRGVADSLGFLGASSASALIYEAINDINRASGELTTIVQLSRHLAHNRHRIKHWCKDMARLGWVEK